MRGTSPLPNPHPLIAMMPAAYQEDDLTVRLTAGLDEVVGPVMASLDCLTGYLDPRLAPEDFLDWLAGWVGVVLDENWPVQRRREAVAHAVELHRCRGTAWGLQWQLDLLTGGAAEVVDSGRVRWSKTPDTESGTDPVSLVVRVRRGALSDGELRAVADVVAWAKPAHVPHEITLVDAAMMPAPG